MKSPLAVVVPFFNPFNSQSMSNNALATVSHLLEKCEHIYFVEVKYTDKSLNQKTLMKDIKNTKAHYIQLKSRDVLFHKERMVNIVARSLLHKYDIIAYADSDILFDDTDWVNRIIESMNECDLIQCFGNGLIRYAIGKKKRPVQSAMKKWITSNNIYGSPGGTWAGGRKFWKIGLFDKLIIGPNDSMLMEAISNGSPSEYHFQHFNKIKFHKQFDENFFCYKNKIKNIIIGYADNDVKFRFHDKSKVKRYGMRMLVMDGFNSEAELKINGDGLYEWYDPCSKRAVLIKEYFRSRVGAGNSWGTIVQFRVMEDTMAGVMEYKKGEDGFLPICLLNYDFRIIW